MSKHWQRLWEAVKPRLIVAAIIAAFVAAGGLIMAQASHGHRLNTHERDIRTNTIDIQTMRAQGDQRWDLLNEKVNKIDRGVSRIEGLLEQRK